MSGWKDVPGWEGYYQVSDDGDVRSMMRRVVRRDGQINTLPQHILRPGPSDGYPTVVLHGGGRKKTEKVHRLVAEAFIPNPLGKPQVNHKNGIRSDSRVENLEWVTGSENCFHAVHVLQTVRPPECHGSDSPLAKLTEGEVLEISARIASGESCYSLAKAFEISNRTAQRIGHGNTWRHLGLTDCERIQENRRSNGHKKPRR
jgi:hypothetical protein